MNANFGNDAGLSGARARVCGLVRRAALYLALAEIAMAASDVCLALSGAARFSVQGAAVPLFLAGLLLWLRKRRGGVEALMAVMTVVVAVTGIDAAIAVLSRPAANTSFVREERARQLGIPYDTRGIPKVVADLRARGDRAYPHIAPSFLVGRLDRPLYPMGGISGKTIVFCNESGKFSIYHSDLHGFNNPDAAWTGARALVLGDSFANGACVQPGEDVASRLRSLGVSALTLGMWGNGPLIELGSLVEYGRAVKPEAVFWLFFENDFDDLAKEAEDPLLMRYLDPGFSQGLIGRQSEIDAYLAKVVGEMYREKGIDLGGPRAARTAGYRLAGLDFDSQGVAQRLGTLTQVASWQHIRSLAGNFLVYRHAGATAALFGRVLARAKAEVEGFGGTLYFVYLPEYFRFTPISYFARRDYARLRELALGAARDNGLTVIDELALFAAQPDPLGLFPLRINGHYTAEADDLIARELASRLGGGDSKGP